jgi:F-type H+-transporting ATPase subunit a
MKHELSLPYLLLKPLLDGLPAELQFLNSDHVVMVTFITLFLIIALPLAGRRLHTDNRGSFQQMLETVYVAIRGMVSTNVNVHPGRHFAVIGGFAVTIVMFNAIGVVPLLTSPTPYLSTTLALAVASFLYYNIQGFREHGPIGYARTFMGPLAALAPLMMISELISHFARLLSLSLRLSGSMSADHVVVGAFTTLFPLVLPAPMVALGLLMAVLQTFIFTMLSTIYIAGAVAEEH